MYTLFYQPEGTWVGDCMPCFHDGKLYLYYQGDTRIPKAFPDCRPFGWSLATTADLMHFNNYGEVLNHGPQGSRDEWLYAGSVIFAEGQFWAYYTARCHAYWNSDTPAELVSIATSPDGMKWTKHPDWTLPKEAGYELNNFRDPCLYFDPENDRWIMLAAQRKSEGPANRRGVLTWHTSRDLKHWAFQGDFWYPGMFRVEEMPDLFRMGDWWYLIFSEYCTGNKTRYRMSKSMEGPWIAPEDDCFDGRCLYAARTYDAGGTRNLVGWLATRREDSDLNSWVWGGTAIVYELHQRQDGTLSVHMPAMQDKLFKTPAKRSLPSAVSLESRTGCDEVILLKDAGEFYRLDCKVTFSSGTYAFGVKMYENSEMDKGYVYHFSPGKNKVIFDKRPNYPWFQCQNRDLYRAADLSSDKEHHLTVIVDRDICILYINGIALSARMCERPGTELKLYVHGGTLNVRDIRYYDQVNQ